MKLIFMVFMFLFFASIEVSLCLSSKTENKNKFLNLLSMKNTASGGPPSPATVSSSYWLQKLFSGKEPLQYLDQSDSSMNLKFFVVQGSNFYYGRNSLTRAIIQGKILHF